MMYYKVRMRIINSTWIPTNGHKDGKENLCKNERRTAGRTIHTSVWSRKVRDGYETR